MLETMSGSILMCHVSAYNLRLYVNLSHDDYSIALGFCLVVFRQTVRPFVRLFVGFITEPSDQINALESLTGCSMHTNVPD